MLLSWIRSQILLNMAGALIKFYVSLSVSSLVKLDTILSQMEREMSWLILSRLEWSCLRCIFPISSLY